MELLSIDYGDLNTMCAWDPSLESRNACLKMWLYVDPTLVFHENEAQRIYDSLIEILPSLSTSVGCEGPLPAGTEGIARLTAGIALELQRDLCEWPRGSCVRCRPIGNGHAYELYVESIDERVGRFAAQLSVNLVRMMLLDEPFDPRLMWVIDLVRLLRRQPRLRLNPKRIASELGCSVENAGWAIEELDRYGYALPGETRRQQHTRSGRILVVDDSARIRDLMSRILETLGYDAITAVDGEEGLILLDWASYEAVFVDILMPCMDGFAFLKEARAQGITCPIFVISAYSHRFEPQQMQAVGASDYLRKPFSVSEIEDLLHRHLA
ncbi:MAG TPA: response regulator [Anaerolineae bacterium]|nr:response regulator [Anaerolineae bacterium]